MDAPNLSLYCTDNMYFCDYVDDVEKAIAIKDSPDKNMKIAFSIVKAIFDTENININDDLLARRLQNIKNNICDDDPCRLYGPADEITPMEKAIQKTMKLLDIITRNEVKMLFDSVMESSKNLAAKFVSNCGLNLSKNEIGQVNLEYVTVIQLNHILSQNPALLRQLSPNTVSFNISKFPASLLTSNIKLIQGFRTKFPRQTGLTPEQIHILNITRLNPLQLVAIGLLNFTKDQIRCLNLSNFTDEILHELVFSIEKEHFHFFNPQTIADNVLRISHMLYIHFSTEQFKCIDYRVIKQAGKQNSFFAKCLALMKNYVDEIPRKEVPRYYTGESSNYMGIKFTGIHNAKVHKTVIQVPKVKTPEYDDVVYKKYQNVVDKAKNFIKDSGLTVPVFSETAFSECETALKSLIFLVSLPIASEEPKVLFLESVKPPLNFVTKETVSKRFKALALKVHPDKNPDFQEVANTIFNVLKHALETILTEK